MTDYAKSKALQKLHLGHIASNRYEITQEDMSSVVVTNCLLHLRYIYQVKTASCLANTREYNMVFP